MKISRSTVIYMYIMNWSHCLICYIFHSNNVTLGDVELLSMHVSNAFSGPKLMFSYTCTCRSQAVMLLSKVTCTYMYLVHTGTACPIKLFRCDIQNNQSMYVDHISTTHVICMHLYVHLLYTVPRVHCVQVCVGLLIVLSHPRCLGPPDAVLHKLLNKVTQICLGRPNDLTLFALFMCNL